MGDAEPEPEPAAAQRERVTVKSSRRGEDDIPPPPEPPADDPSQAVVMVSEDQLIDLEQLRQAEKYDDELSWLSFVGGAVGRKVAKVSDLTATEAEQVIAVFNDASGGAK